MSLRSDHDISITCIYRHVSRSILEQGMSISCKSFVGIQQIVPEILAAVEIDPTLEFKGMPPMMSQ
jgi:hypothetical protein